MKIFLLYLLITLSFSSFSQVNKTEWLKLEPINSRVEVVTSKADYNGNLYVLSSFRDSITFEENEFYSKEKGAFLTKYNSQGEIEWSIQIGTGLYTRSQTISISTLGNVFLTSMDKRNEKDFDLNLLKLSSDGHKIWQKRIFDESNSVNFQSLLISKTEEIYFMGTFNSDLILTDLNQKKITLTLIERQDYFNIKFNSNGDILWANSTGGNGYINLGTSCLHPNGNIVTVGSFSKNIILDEDTVKSKGNTDMFIKTLTPDGEFSSIKIFGQKNYERANSVTVDDDGGIYISGTFDGELELNVNEVGVLLKPNGYSDAILFKLDRTHNIEWIKTVGDQERSKAKRIYLGKNDLIHWTGEFMGDIDFNPTELINKVSSAGEGHRYLTPFILTMNKSGDFIHVAKIETPNHHYVNHFSINSNEKVFTTGRWVDEDAPYKERTYAQFVQRKNLYDSKSKNNIEACSSYIWPINNVTYTKSGKYTFIEKVSRKNEIVHELNLTIRDISTKIKVNGNDLKALEKDATFLWIKYNDGDSISVMSTGEYFTARKSGVYAVVVTSKFCPISDTSKKVKIEILDIPEDDLRNYYELDRNVVVRKFGREHVPLIGSNVDMIPFRVDDRFGFVQKMNPEKWLIQPRFEQVYAVYKQGAIVKDTAARYGLIGSDGEYIIPPFFQNLFLENDVFHGVIASASDTSLHLPEDYNSFNFHRYYSLTGELLFDENSHQHGSFYFEDLAWFRFGKTYHIRNKKGELVKEFEVNEEKTFLGVANSNLLYQTNDYSKREYTAYSIHGDLKFQLPINTQSKLYQLGSNLIGLLASDGDYFFYDSLGKEKPYAQTTGYVGFHASDPGFLKQEEFIVRNIETQKVGVINTNGNIIIPFKFKAIKPIINGLRLCVSDDNKLNYYNAENKLIVTDKYQNAYYLNSRMNPAILLQEKAFYDGVSIGWDSKKTIETAADGTEREVYHQDEYTLFIYDVNMEILQVFEDHIIACGNFNEGLAPAITNNKKLGFINKKGEWIIQPNYEISVAGSYPMPYFVIPKFIDGFAYIKSFKGYIDQNGKEYFSGKRMEDHYDFSH